LPTVATRGLLELNVTGSERRSPWREYSVTESVRCEPDTRRAGRGCLRYATLDGRDEVEVAYGFMSDFWGQGYATEMAAESVRVAFEMLKLSEIVCFTLPTNLASRRVMEKVGFRYERDTIYADLPHVLCRLKRDGG